MTDESLSPGCVRCPDPGGTCFPGPCKIYVARANEKQRASASGTAHPRRDPSGTGWRPTSELNPTDRMYINVRVTTVTTYRWRPYKPDGARQMGVKGRWQRARDPDGWENAKLPADGEWVPNQPGLGPDAGSVVLSADPPDAGIHVSRGSLEKINIELLDLRSRYWDSKDIDAALAVDSARNKIADALHDLRRAEPETFDAP